MTDQPTEAELHRSVAELLDWMLLRPAMWTTFPAGWTKMRKGAAGRLHGAGLKAGMPDAFVFHNGRTIGIELKTPSGKVSPVQFDMFEKLRLAGVPVHVCRSVDEVHEALAAHKIPMRKFSLGHPQAKARRTPQPDAGAATA
jgi:hypothetical protein